MNEKEKRIIEMSDNMVLALDAPFQLNGQQENWILRTDDSTSAKQLLHLFITDGNDPPHKLSLSDDSQMFVLYQDVHVCGVCHEQFVDLISFLQHKTNHAVGEGLYRCDLCPCILPTSADLVQHYSKHHHLLMAKAFTSESVHTNTDAIEDITIVQNNDELLQDLDNDKIDSDVISDITLCGSNGIEDIVQNIGTDQTDFSSHALESVAKSSIHSNRSKKRHKTVTTNPVSTARPSEAAGQKAGRRPVTVVSIYPCPVCGKIFRRRRYLRKHVETHGASHACDVCGKTYRSQAYLRLHRRRHAKVETPPKPRFSCTKCKFTSDVAAAIHAHRQVHAPKDSVRCAICGGAYADRAALSKHRRVHDAARPFACPLPGCAWRFRTDVMCRAHVRAHTVAGRFRCSTCGYVFRRKHHLQRHEARMHADDSPRPARTTSRAASRHPETATTKPAVSSTFTRHRDVMLSATNDAPCALTMTYEPGDLIVDEDCGYTSLLDVANLECEKKNDFTIVDDLDHWLS